MPWEVPGAHEFKQPPRSDAKEFGALDCIHKGLNHGFLSI
jgi:hypothetical protein